MIKKKIEVILACVLMFIVFLVVGFLLLFGSFSSAASTPVIPEEYFIYFVMGAIVIFIVLMFFLAYYVQQKTSNPAPILNPEDYNGANSLRVMAVGATIASLTFTIYVITQKTLGLGFLRILIFPAISSSITSALAFIFRKFRAELLFVSVGLLLLVFVMSIFILPKFF